MCKVKLVIFCLAVSAGIWAVNTWSDAPPKLIAGAAKNHTRAIVVTDPTQYAAVATLKTAD